MFLFLVTEGVGKTSLAQTAATEFHPSDSEPIVVAGAEGETFGSIIGSIINRSQAENDSTPFERALNDCKFAVYLAYREKNN